MKAFNMPISACVVSESGERFFQEIAAAVVENAEAFLQKCMGKEF